MTEKPTFRFAPSPNGLLHLGHAFSALLNAKMARQRNGELLLRIEDIDTARSKPELVQAILSDMAWLEIPFAPDHRHQSDHFASYAKAIKKLQALDVLYPCFCTRTDITKASDGSRDPDGAPRYPGTCKHLTSTEIAAKEAAGIPYSLRLDAKRAEAVTGKLTWQELISPEADKVTNIAVDLPAWGDTILVRKDTPTSYHLAVTVSDAAQKITHIVRGKDLYYATSIHRTLQALLDLPTPIYFHHALITDDTMQKLSKSKKSRTLQSLRKAGWTRADVLNELANHLG